MNLGSWTQNLPMSSSSSSSLLSPTSLLSLLSSLSPSTFGGVVEPEASVGVVVSAAVVLVSPVSAEVPVVLVAVLSVLPGVVLSSGVLA